MALSDRHYKIRKSLAEGRAKARLVQYAVVFEPFETEGLEYVKQGCGAMWDDKSPVKVFNTQEEAQKEADKWNTGQVVQYG